MFSFTKLVAPFFLTSFAALPLLAGCAAETSTDSAATEQSATAEQAWSRSCRGLSTATCERTKGCMEKDESCVVSCTVNGGCVTKCTTACEPLDCSALKSDECGTFSGGQCQLAKGCLVSCRVGTGCTTTCSNSCVPTTVDCTKLDADTCSANADRCQAVPGACVVSCRVGTGCTTTCAPSTCAPITG